MKSELIRKTLLKYGELFYFTITWVCFWCQWENKSKRQRDKAFHWLTVLMTWMKMLINVPKQFFPTCGDDDLQVRDHPDDHLQLRRHEHGWASSLRGQDSLGKTIGNLQCQHLVHELKELRSKKLAQFLKKKASWASFIWFLRNLTAKQNHHHQLCQVGHPTPV